MTTPAPQAADEACAFLALPPALTERVLALLAAEDARAACAAACVSIAWARAAAAPAVWRDLCFASPHPTRVAPLTDERLAALVARAGGALRSLDVSGCVELTDAGIAAALSHLVTLRRVKLRATPPPASKYDVPRQVEDSDGWYADSTIDYDPHYDRRDDSEDDDESPPIRKFSTRELGRTQLSAGGIAAALRASAPLEELCVDGFRHAYYSGRRIWNEDDFNDFHDDYDDDDDGGGGGGGAPAGVDDDDDDADDPRDNDARAALATLLPLVGGAERLDVVLCGTAGPTGPLRLVPSAKTVREPPRGK